MGSFDIVKDFHDTLGEIFQLDLSIQSFIKCIVIIAIEELPSDKASGFDLITSGVSKELPDVGISFLTELFNDALIRRYVPL